MTHTNCEQVDIFNAQMIDALADALEDAKAEAVRFSHAAMKNSEAANQLIREKAELKTELDKTQRELRTWQQAGDFYGIGYAPGIGMYERRDRTQRDVYMNALEERLAELRAEIAELRE